MWNKRNWLIAIAVIALFVVGYNIYYTPKVHGWFMMSKTRRTEDPSRTNHIGAPFSRSGKKVLVVYFTWGGNTREVAQHIHDVIGGDVYEIRTVNEYPSDYDSCTKVAKKELEENARPELIGRNIRVDEYDTVFIGYPIWWYAAPRAVLSFVERYSFAGKEVVPFCTSGGDDLSETLDELKGLKAMQGAEFKDGLTANVWDDIDPWLVKLGY
ncbi:MAG: flavodoxin [Selenomonadaceae bacterium]